MKKTTLFVLSCLLTVLVYSQARPLSTNSSRAERFYNQGLREFDQNNMQEAIALFGRALNEDPNFTEAWLMLGETFELSSMPDSAIWAYRRFVELDPSIHPFALSRLGSLELSQGFYEEAEESFLRYLATPIRSDEVRERAEANLQRARTAIKFRNNPVPFEPVNLGDSINSEMDEYFPVLTVDGRTMIFTRRTRIETERTYVVDRRTGRPLRDASHPNAMTVTRLVEDRREDFYFSTFCDSTQTWKNAVRMPYPITTDDNEGAPSISPDGRYLFFAGCNRRDGFGSCDIYVSRRVGDSWGRPFNLGPPINTRFWESQPSIAPDGRTLFFASNRPGGKGGTDIWMTVLQDNGMWSEPENLGYPINTSGNESAPFIHYDNQTLYFVSDGHPGLGGKDIFVSRRNPDGTWGTPVNLGYPINTHRDESSFFVNSRGDKAFISSNRSGGKGGTDIYVFELHRDVRPLAVSYLRGNLFDARTHLPLDARLEIINLRTGQVVARAEADEVSGEFLVTLPSDGSYALNISREGYLFHSEHFEFGDIANQIQPITIDVPLAQIQQGESIVLRNIFFATAEYALQPESIQELERLVRFMNENPGVRIEISGHTDNVGSVSFNQRLSENRAKSVYDFLISRGIRSDRLEFAGYGMSRPVAPNDTEEGRAQNRRTEIQIL
ncbi:MAG: OmpA family protein [Bacteroidales bacterium]|nr:OmpA family protein [Bacteroidales bacterium]